jgi:hypothetical protein
MTTIHSDELGSRSKSSRLVIGYALAMQCHCLLMILFGNL